MTKSAALLLGFASLTVAWAGCASEYGSSAAADADAAPDETPSPGTPDPVPTSAPTSTSTGQPVKPPPLGDAGGVDAASTADSGSADTSAPVACVAEPFATGAFNMRCSASAAATTTGGAPAPGTYNLARVYQSDGCATARYNIGSMTIFTADGKTFMRHIRLRRTATDDPGTTSSGTYRLDLDGAGNVVRTEECDPSTTGAQQTGTIQVTGAAPDELTFTFADHQERWKKAL